MKAMLILLAVLGSLSAQAKDLGVGCKSADEKLTIGFTSEIYNANEPQKINSFTVNGKAVTKFKDVTAMPIYQKGNIKIKLQYGPNLFSSAEFTLINCADEFESTGTAVVYEYVGGFAGTQPTDMKCTCVLTN